MESNAWLITETCPKLIECIPQLVRGDRRQEDIRKVDGDDPADAARYGLPPPEGSPVLGRPLCPVGRGRPFHQPLNTPHFVTGMPLGEQIARQVSAKDRTSRAIHYQRLEAEAKKAFRPAKLPRRRW
jgi:hypothetical protein